MAKVNFYLNKDGVKAEKAIYLYLSYNNHRVKLSTRESIKPKLWNSKQQKARADKKEEYPEYSDLNNLLDNLRSHTLSVYRKFTTDSNREPSSREIKDLVKQFWQRNKSGKNSPIAFFAELIKLREESKDYSYNSIKTYKSALIRFREFAKKGYEFTDMDVDFYNRFKIHLRGKNYTDNYVYKVLSLIKTFHNEAAKKGLCGKLEFSFKNDLKLSKEKPPKIYLKSEELDILYYLALGERLTKARDLFLIGAYTGLRYSDFSILTQDNFKEREGKLFIEIITQKTKEGVVIPVNPFLKSILEKYNWKSPKLSNQKLNEYLKEVGQKAGFTEDIVLERQRGKEVIKTSFKKYNLLATHTARRSFASNAYYANVPIRVIMKITGHKTESEFLRYIRVSKKDSAFIASSHEFFNQVPRLQKVS